MAKTGHPHVVKERIGNKIAILEIEPPTKRIACCVQIERHGKMKRCGKVATRIVKGEGFCSLPSHSLIAFQRQRENNRLEKLTKSTMKKYYSNQVPQPVSW